MGDEGLRGGFRGGQRGRGSHRHRKRPRFYKGGTEEDPLNLRNVGIDPEEEAKEEEEEDNQIQGHMPKNPRDPLGIEKIERAARKRQAREEQEAAEKKQKLEAIATKQDGEVKEETPDEAAARKKREKKEHFNKKYHYGNFDQYYGTRLSTGEKDARLKKLPKELFYKKNVLDIGCNVGYLTLSIAKEYEPRRILGIDIDEHLIGVARKNIRHYCDAGIEFSGKFPASFGKTFGPISQTSLNFSTKFPDNIWFRKDNYVLEEDFMLEMVEPEYNVILALSITKWIHLNWCDAGLKRFFQRAFNHLLPEGIFILEPQAFESYKKRAKMLPELWNVYKDIKFKPDQFKEYLLDIVGFERVEELGEPEATSKGFSRPIEVYYKPKAVKKESKLAPKSTKMEPTAPGNIED